MIIDEKPIRRRAIARCIYILKQFDSVLEDLDRYESTDLPAYRRWVHRTFGATLTELRELNQEVGRLEFLVSQIQTLRLFNRMSVHEAYRHATEAQENPEDFVEEEFDEDWSSEDEEEAAWDDEDAYEDDGESGSLHLSDEEVAAILHDLFGHEPAIADLDTDSETYRTLIWLLRKLLQTRGPEVAQAEREFLEYYDRVIRGEDPAEVSRHHESEASRLKALYRSLAKTLHPDNRVQSESSQDELWYRVQDAFARQDLAELQMLEANYHVRHARRLDHLPVSQILAVHANYKEELRVLRRRHRDVQRDTAWQFTTIDDPQKEELRRSHERMFNEEVTWLRSRKADLDKLMATYSKPPERKSSPRKRWTPPEEQLSLFDSD